MLFGIILQRTQIHTCAEAGKRDHFPPLAFLYIKTVQQFGIHLLRENGLVSRCGI
jgi:hypothetical protein